MATLSAGHDCVLYQVGFVSDAVGDWVAAHLSDATHLPYLQEVISKLSLSPAPAVRQAAARACHAVGRARAWEQDWMVDLLEQLRGDGDVDVSAAALACCYVNGLPRILM